LSHTGVTQIAIESRSLSQPVSVIIVNYNSGSLLTRSLEALRKQTLRPKQICVVDNASRDGSCDRIPTDFPEVTLICLEQNTGFAAANNLAVRRADGCEWIALLNPDAFPEPNWLETLMDAAARHPEYSFFGSRMLMADSPDLLDGVGDVYHVSGLHWREGHGQRVRGNYLHEKEIFAPCAAAALYRRDIFLEAGGFDEDYFCYAEDIDLGFRLRLLGYRCLYVPDAVVQHQGSASTGNRSDFSTYHGHRNLVWAYVKNMPGPLFWLYLPLHIAMNAATIVWYTLKGRWRVILKSKWDAIRGLSKMWKKRREVQARRVLSAREIGNMMEKLWPLRGREIGNGEWRS